MDEIKIELDLSIETLALLGQQLPARPPAFESVPIRSCDMMSATPPLCCP